MSTAWSEERKAQHSAAVKASNEKKQAIIEQERATLKAEVRAEIEAEIKTQVKPVEVAVPAVPVAVKHKVTSPWRPAKLLDIPEKFKDPNFVYRFCDKTKEGNIAKKQVEGWEVDKELSKKMSHLQHKTVRDGSSLDGTLQLRELVVMRMPVETKIGREQYYAEKASRTETSVQDKFKTDAGSLAQGYGKGSYGTIQEDRGVAVSD